MFGGKEKNGSATKSSSSSSSLGALNTLVEGTVVEGQVTAKSDIRVDGMIRGSLTCEGKVIIGATGFVEGQIKCDSAVIQGRFEGTLDVNDLLNVRQTAKINGEISTGKLIVESGAIFNVTCKMGSQASSNGKQTQRKATTQVKRVKAS